MSVFSNNCLNLPKEVKKDNNNKIVYTYDAIGNKFKKSSTIGEVTTNRYYSGIFEYGNTKALELIHTDEGMVNVSGTTYTYEYHLKDHLGNVRAVLSSNGTMSQKTDYYPFGMISSITQSGSTDNNYLYNGKEIQEELDLDWYDYGARFYDPQIGRFHTIDPMAERYIKESPYVYVGNKPMIMIDPDGMAYRPTKDSTGAYNGFEWVDDKVAYDKNGKLLDGYFEKAILFSDNGTWTLGVLESGRYISYNLGSATATVYDYVETTDENGNIIRSAADPVTYNATTSSSDPSDFNTVKRNILLQAVRHTHNSSGGPYMALQLRNLSGLDGIPSTTNGTIWGANIHKAGQYIEGKGYSTGTYYKKGDSYELRYGQTYSTPEGPIFGFYQAPITTYRYSGVSEACFLINNPNWSSFISHFPKGVGRIGVINK
jgi:RHS repeat-associated protein